MVLPGTIGETQMNKIIAVAAVLTLGAGSAAMAQTYGAANSRAQAAQEQTGQVQSGVQAYARALDSAIVAPAHVNPAEY